ncbi:MAG: hypothetical protein LBM75_05025, partial [Myxococcales bacterium]|nr:hypothetical protein [Myxococcales bacterium]
LTQFNWTGCLKVLRVSAYAFADLLFRFQRTTQLLSDRRKTARAFTRTDSTCQEVFSFFFQPAASTSKTAKKNKIATQSPLLSGGQLLNP